MQQTREKQVYGTDSNLLIQEYNQFGEIFGDIPKGSFVAIDYENTLTLGQQIANNEGKDITQPNPAFFKLLEYLKRRECVTSACSSKGVPEFYNNTGLIDYVLTATIDSKAHLSHAKPNGEGCRDTVFSSDIQCKDRLGAMNKIVAINAVLQNVPGYNKEKGKVFLLDNDKRYFENLPADNKVICVNNVAGLRKEGTNQLVSGKLDTNLLMKVIENRDYLKDKTIEVKMKAIEYNGQTYHVVDKTIVTDNKTGEEISFSSYGYVDTKQEDGRITREENYIDEDNSVKVKTEIIKPEEEKKDPIIDQDLSQKAGEEQPTQIQKVLVFDIDECLVDTDALIKRLKHEGIYNYNPIKRNEAGQTEVGHHSLDKKKFLQFVQDVQNSNETCPELSALFELGRLIREIQELDPSIKIIINTHTQMLAIQLEFLKLIFGDTVNFRVGIDTDFTKDGLVKRDGKIGENDILVLNAENKRCIQTTNQGNHYGWNDNEGIISFYYYNNIESMNNDLNDSMTLYKNGKTEILSKKVLSKLPDTSDKTKYKIYYFDDNANNINAVFDKWYNLSERTTEFPHIKNVETFVVHNNRPNRALIDHLKNVHQSI